MPTIGIKPQVKVYDPKGREFKELLKRMKGVGRSYVTIGVHSDAGRYTEGKSPPSVAEVALWNEYGVPASPRRPAIPERSYLRSAIDQNASLINKWREELMRDIIDGKRTAEDALRAMGFRIQVLVQNKIKSNVPPPNAKRTVERKRKKGLAPNTLIETGLLLRSIGFKVHAK